MTQATALALTIGVELVVALAIARGAGWTRTPRELGWLAAAVVAASLLTHPFAWWTNTELVGAFSFPVRAAVIEVSVSLLETAVLALAGVLSWPRSAVVAFTMNAVSFGVGVAVQVF